MRKKLPKDEIETRSQKREKKKRPRMRMHGAGLKRRGGKHEAGYITKRAK